MKVKGGKIKKHLAVFLVLALIFTTFLGDVGIIHAEESVETEVHTAPGNAAVSEQSEESTESMIAPGPLEHRAEISMDPAQEQQKDISNPEAPNDRSNPSADVPEEEYAALEEFLKAADAVGNVGEQEALLPALDSCLDIYHRLSPEDQAAQAEAYAYLTDYRTQAAAENPDQGIAALAANGETTIYLYLNGVSLGVRKVISSNDLGWAGKSLSWVVQTYFPTYYNASDNYKYRNNSYGFWSGGSTSKINQEDKFVDINIIGTGNQGGGGTTDSSTLQVRTEVRAGSAAGALIASDDGTAQTVTKGTGVYVTNYNTIPAYDTSKYGTATLAKATRTAGGYWKVTASSTSQSSSVEGATITFRPFFPASGTNKVTVIYTVPWKNYTITYKDGKNGAAFTDQVYSSHYGDATPAYTPQKEFTDANGRTWLFKGWNPTVKATVDGDQTYTAMWEEKNSDPIIGPGPGDGTVKGNFTVQKRFENLPDSKLPEVTLKYEVTYTKDGVVQSYKESGTLAMSKTAGGTMEGKLEPSMWRIYDPDSNAYKNILYGDLSDSEKGRYQMIITITESGGEVSGYSHTFKATFPADGQNTSDNSVAFKIPCETFAKMLSLKNTYTRQPDIPVTEIPEKPSCADINAMSGKLSIVCEDNHSHNLNWSLGYDSPWCDRSAEVTLGADGKWHWSLTINVDKWIELDSNWLKENRTGIDYNHLKNAGTIEPLLAYFTFHEETKKWSMDSNPIIKIEGAKVTYRWLDASDRVIKTVTRSRCLTAPTPAFDGELPKKDPSNQKVYVFEKWSDPEITDDGSIITYRPVFKEYDDKIGNDPNKPGSTDKPDGIPDIYQAIVTFDAVNGTLTGPTRVVVTKKDADGNDSETGTAILTADQIPTAAANEGYGNGTWTPAIPVVGYVIVGNTDFVITYTQNPGTDPVDPNPVDPNPVDPNPVDPNPVDPNPVDPNPVDPNPVDPNPVDPNPIDPNPVNPNPVDPNPVDPNPVDPNPVNPNPVGPNPEIPETPTVTPATLAVTPTTPVAPVATPIAQAAQTPAAVTPPAEQPVEIADAETPLANAQTPSANEDTMPANEEEQIEDEEVPLAPGNGGHWALINFALMNLAIFESLMLLIGYFVKTKNEEEKEEEKRKLKKKGIIRILSIPVAVISLIAFILTEDITLLTGFVDKYTIWMAIIAILQTVMVVLSHKKYQKEEEEA